MGSRRYKVSLTPKAASIELGMSSDVITVYGSLQADAFSFQVFAANSGSTDWRLTRGAMATFEENDVLPAASPTIYFTRAGGTVTYDAARTDMKLFYWFEVRVEEV